MRDDVAVVDGSEVRGEDGVTALLQPKPKNAMARAASGFMRLSIAPSRLGLHAPKARLSSAA